MLINLDNLCDHILLQIIKYLTFNDVVVLFKSCNRIVLINYLKNYLDFNKKRFINDMGQCGECSCTGQMTFDNVLKKIFPPQPYNSDESSGSCSSDELSESYSSDECYYTVEQLKNHFQNRDKLFSYPDKSVYGYRFNWEKNSCPYSHDTRWFSIRNDYYIYDTVFVRNFIEICHTNGILLKYCEPPHTDRHYCVYDYEVENDLINDADMATMTDIINTIYIDWSCNVFCRICGGKNHLPYDKQCWFESEKKYISSILCNHKIKMQETLYLIRFGCKNCKTIIRWQSCDNSYCKECCYHNCNCRKLCRKQVPFRSFEVSKNKFL